MLTDLEARNGKPKSQTVQASLRGSRGQCILYPQLVLKILFLSLHYSVFAFFWHSLLFRVFSSLTRTSAIAFVVIQDDCSLKSLFWLHGPKILFFSKYGEICRFLNIALLGSQFNYVHQISSCQYRLCLHELLQVNISQWRAQEDHTQWDGARREKG